MVQFNLLSKYQKAKSARLEKLKVRRMDADVEKFFQDGLLPRPGLARFEADCEGEDQYDVVTKLAVEHTKKTIAKRSWVVWYGNNCKAARKRFRKHQSEEILSKLEIFLSNTDFYYKHWMEVAGDGDEDETHLMEKYRRFLNTRVDHRILRVVDMWIQHYQGSKSDALKRI